MSHTPGPWRIEEFRKGSYLVTARNAGIAREGLVAQHVPGSANARLIAAAPELYEALNEALINIERVLRGDRKAVPFRAEWIEEARAICAKVRGDEEERR